MIGAIKEYLCTRLRLNIGLDVIGEIEFSIDGDIISYKILTTYTDIDSIKPCIYSNHSIRREIVNSKVLVSGVVHKEYESDLFNRLKDLI